MGPNGGGRAIGRDHKRAQGNFRCDEYTHYPDSGVDFMGTHIYQNLLKWAL